MPCFRVAVVGQPNVGKSTFINVLLGKYVSHVANWPGVTVDIKVIEVEVDGKEVCLYDFPGMYSLTPASEEERIAVEKFVNERFDNYILIADMTSLKRTLYLVVQALELKGKGVVALGKADAAEKVGIHVNVSLLAKRLGFPVVPFSSYGMKGVDDVLLEALKPQRERELYINYGDLEYYVARGAEILGNSVPGNPRWFAAEALAGNPVAWEVIEKAGKGEEMKRLVEEARKEIGEDLGKIIVSERWKFIDSLLEGVVSIERVVREAWWAKALDKALLHPVLGPLAAALILFSVIFVAFSINTGFPANVLFEALGLKGLANAIEHYNTSELLGNFFTYLADTVKSSVPGWLGSLLGDGVIAGVGAVLSFFPLIFTIYFLLAVLEDSGVAPRIAVAFDPIFRAVGLTGKAIFPLIISVGCNVPGVVSSRVMESPSLRKAVAMNVMYVPCQARLVVFLALASLLPAWARSLSVAIVYAYSIGVFVVMTYLTSRLIFKVRERPELIMELPPYHVPKLKIVLWMTWDQAKHFLEKAGTIILVFSVLLWFAFEGGLAQAVGRALEPLSEWALGLKGQAAQVINVAMLAGTIAKEVVLDVLAMHAGTSNVKEAMKVLGLGPAQALALMFAIAVYVPCVATIATMREELGSWKLVLLSILFSIIISLLTAKVVSSAASVIF